MITCRARLDVPRELAQYLGRPLHDITAVARDHGISRATGYRYLDQVITVLADQAPDLHEALQQAQQDGLACVILDGKVFSADRLAEKTTSVKGEEIDLWYSGKAHEHGGNIQALPALDGFPLWVSEIEPGSVHDLTAATSSAPCSGPTPSSTCPHSPTTATTGAGIGVFTPVKQPADGQALDPDTRTYNALLRGLRCLGERHTLTPSMSVRRAVNLCGWRFRG